MRIKRRVHQITHDVGVFRDLNPDGVFNGAYGSQCMDAGTNTTDAFDECPRVTWVSAFQNHFQAAPHRARALGVRDDVLFINRCLNAQMAFNASDRVNNDTTIVISHYSSLPMSLLFFLARACATADMAACAIAAAPTTPAVARPTLSTVASIPPRPGGRMVVS